MQLSHCAGLRCTLTISGVDSPLSDFIFSPSKLWSNKMSWTYGLKLLKPEMDICLVCNTHCVYLPMICFETYSLPFFSTSLCWRLEVSRIRVPLWQFQCSPSILAKPAYAPMTTQQTGPPPSPACTMKLLVIWEIPSWIKHGTVGGLSGST